MSIIWATGRDGDGHHNLFTNRISCLKKMERVTSKPDIRVCQFGKVYNYYPKNPDNSDLSSFKEEEEKLTEIYLWCDENDGFNLGKYAIFKTKENLLEYCDSIDENIVNDMTNE